MMKKWIYIFAMLAGFSGSLFASTWDDIKAIDEAKQAKFSANNTKESTPAASAHWMKLSDGRSVNVSNWTVVLFMQSSCSYCKQFDPVLAQYAKETGINVSVFSMDGQGDETFPQVMKATPEVMVEFFGNGLPIATPTTYLVNVNTMATFPLLQGAVERHALASRIDEVLRIALNKGEK